ncbi:CCA tRNA nucleotidyltransferase [Pseudogracilibacillus sp. SE30717A]|uniref:CCA tRNA nucleotidyltransferase n=1 Tax=Pseudogracilibacillus sp. SE30717A TaxID=3098293 RepID=UPI00300DCBE6
MLMNIFEEAAEVITRLENNGYEAYFVGGCVRDSLLQREIKDVDIATSASPEKVQELFEKVIPVGVEHGTVVVRYKGKSYEVTTFRKEGTYSDQRHPDEVIFINNIDDDLKRRDFTINSLAMNKEGEIIDLFNGRADIEQRIIRSVGNPKDRFLEDPLRIIRALRFASQLGFQIEKNTFLQMRQQQKEIETVAVERLTIEITKLFQGEYVQNGLNYLIEVEAFKYLPIFKNHKSLIKKLPPLTAFHSFAEVIALLHYLDKSISISQWVKEWKCSNKVRSEAINLSESIEYYYKSGLDAWLIYRLHYSNVKAFTHLVKIISNDLNYSSNELTTYKKQLPIQKRVDLDFDGHDLHTVFPDFKKGPWMNKLLEDLEYRVVMRYLENKKPKIKEWIICHPPEIN